MITREQYLEALSTKLYLYFIQGIYGGPIKIGVSDHYLQRLNQLQTSHHEKLRVILLATNCHKGLEQELHNYFSKYRLKGEWFNGNILADPESIEETIKSMNWHYRVKKELPKSACIKIKWLININHWKVKEILKEEMMRKDGKIVPISRVMLA